MLVKVKNEGNRIFLQNGHWLEKGEEVVLPADQARLLLLINPKIVKISDEGKKKRK